MSIAALRLPITSTQRARILLSAAFVAVVVILFATGTLPARRWEPFLVPTTWTFFLGGMRETLYMGVTALVASVLIGLPLGILRADLRGPLRILVVLWVELVRATPILAIILIVFFGLARAGINLSGTTAAIVALAVYNSAVLGEIVRAGIGSIARGEVEASRSLGLSYPQTMRYVVLPQALSRMTPAIVSQLITLIKDTSLAFIVGGTVELVSTGRSFFVYYGNVMETYIVLALLFFSINYPLSRLSRRLEARRPAEQRLIVTGEEDQLATATAAIPGAMPRQVTGTER